MTLLVFTTGMLFSDFMDNRRQNSLQSQMSENLVEVEGQQLQLSYLQSEEVNSCDAMRAGVRGVIRDYNKRLNNVQQYQDNTLFQQNEFELIRDRYVLSGIRYYLFVNELNGECDRNTTTVLFFTESLNAEDCDDCQYVGRQLELLKNQYGKEVLIFSIPSSMESGIIDVMEQQHNITERPAVVINSEEKLEGAYSKEELEMEIFG